MSDVEWESHLQMQAAKEREDRVKLRDFFAAHALSAVPGWGTTGEPGIDADKAARCYRIADAMLKEREKKP